MAKTRATISRLSRRHHRKMIYGIFPLVLVVMCTILLAVPALASETGWLPGTTFSGTCLNPGNAQTDNGTRADFDSGENLVASGFALQGDIPASATAISFAIRINGRVSNVDNSETRNRSRLVAVIAMWMLRPRPVPTTTLATPGATLNCQAATSGSG
jgi:hypothetical protein